MMVSPNPRKHMYSTGTMRGWTVKTGIFTGGTTGSVHVEGFEDYMKVLGVKRKAGIQIRRRHARALLEPEGVLWNSLILSTAISVQLSTIGTIPQSGPMVVKMGKAVRDQTAGWCDTRHAFGEDNKGECREREINEYDSPDGQGRSLS